MQDRDVLLLAGDDVEDREAIDEAILQLLERLEEHDVVGRAVAVEQEEAAVGLARQHALHDRQDRRDAGAGREADMDSAGIRWRDRTETSGRRHHIELVTAFQFVRRPARKRAAVDLLHRDTDLAVVGAGADGIGAAHLFAIEGRAQREILAGGESIVTGEFAREW